MAKTGVERVVLRLTAGHRNYLPQRLSMSTGSIRRSITDPKTTGQSLWMKATPEMSLEKDSLLEAIDKLKDDQEIHKELSVNGSEASSLNRPAARKLDTHALVKTLMAGGFTLQQAEALTMTMVGVVDESTDGLRNFMVSKPQAELTVQKIASQLAILRRDMMIMEKADFTELITKIERITHELQQLQRTTKDEMTKIRSDMTLDFNLEKGKVKDMHLDHLKVVENKHATIFEKLTMIDKELQNIRSYINTENAAIQTIFERYKSDTIKLAFGAVATCMTIVLGFYRLWS